MPTTILPRRLHHHAYVVADQERTRHFYEDILAMPLVATWCEKEHVRGKEREYCHTFFSLADGSALATWGEAGHVFARRLFEYRLSAAPQDLTLPSLGDTPGGLADAPDVGIEDDSSYAWVAFRQTFGGTPRAIARRLVGAYQRARSELPADDPEILHGEFEILTIFADLAQLSRNWPAAEREDLDARFTDRWWRR